MQYSYWETKDVVAISFYGPRKARDGCMIWLEEHLFLFLGTERIKLLKKVKYIKEIHFDEYKTEIVLKKEFRERWKCLNSAHRNSYVYEPPKIDLEEICFEKKEHNTLESLFEDIYANGNEEVKRAMNKSFFESNGTVLCTDWKKLSQEKTWTMAD